MSTLPALLSLNCYIIGYGDMFDVEIDSNLKVSRLRSAIKEANIDLLGHVDAMSFILWAVSIPLNDSVINISEVPPGSRRLLSASRIITYFQQVQVDYLHIIIERPSLILTLQCYVLGDCNGRRNIFPVEIADTKMVNQLLKEVIKAKNTLLRHTDSHRLRIWATSLPTDDNDFDDEKEPLDLVQLLSDIFLTHPVQGAVYIVIQKPYKKLDTVAPFKSILTARSERYVRKKNRPPLSTLGQTQNFESHQENDKEYYGCCRPQNREPDLPLVLLDPVFAIFVDETKTAALTGEDYAIARSLRSTMCEFYDGEPDRASVLRKELQRYKIVLCPAQIGSSGCSTDGHKESNNRPVLITKVKNEIGLGTAEPSIQAMLYYDLFFSEDNLWTEVSSYHPCFIMFLAGPYLGIGGCALTDRPTLEIFSLFPLNFHDTNDGAYDTLARHLSALRAGVDSLVARYSRLPITGPPQDSLPSRHLAHHHVFPYQTTFTSPLGKVEFSYTGIEEGNSLIFTGKADKKDRIWIKFVQRYGKDVHDWCSQQGFAPKLLGLETLPGGWFMVVMEHLDETWICLADSKTCREDLRGPIQAAITRLHQEGRMVHGDIRNTNIMVKETGEPGFMLVDFDWAGRIGEVNYPKFLNPDPAIGRPVAAKDCTPILAEHDDHMFQQLFS